MNKKAILSFGGKVAVVLVGLAIWDYAKPMLNKAKLSAPATSSQS